MEGSTKPKLPWNMHIGEAHNGDFDWLAPGWGAAVCYLLGDAEDLVEEEEALNLVHPADVLAMADGAEDATLPTGGNLAQQCQRLLRDIRAVAMMYMPGDHAVTNLLTNLEEELFRPITVDSQATEEGSRASKGPFLARHFRGCHRWGRSNPELRRRRRKPRGTHGAVAVGAGRVRAPTRRRSTRSGGGSGPSPARGEWS